MYNVTVIKIHWRLAFAGGHAWNNFLKLASNNRIYLAGWISSCHTNLIICWNQEWLYCDTWLKVQIPCNEMHSVKFLLTRNKKKLEDESRWTMQLVNKGLLSLWVTQDKTSYKYWLLFEKLIRSMLYSCQELGWWKNMSEADIWDIKF